MKFLEHFPPTHTVGSEVVRALWQSHSDKRIIFIGMTLSITTPQFSTLSNPNLLLDGVYFQFLQ